jgi:hypothetical protein
LSVYLLTITFFSSPQPLGQFKKRLGPNKSCLTHGKRPLPKQKSKKTLKSKREKKILSRTPEPLSKKRDTYHP